MSITIEKELKILPSSVTFVAFRWSRPILDKGAGSHSIIGLMQPRNSPYASKTSICKTIMNLNQRFGNSQDTWHPHIKTGTWVHHGTVTFSFLSFFFMVKFCFLFTSCFCVCFSLSLSAWLGLANKNSRLRLGLHASAAFQTSWCRYSKVALGVRCYVSAPVTKGKKGGGKFLSVDADDLSRDVWRFHKPPKLGWSIYVVPQLFFSYHLCDV